MKWSGDGLRILDFDIENRPLSYLGSDYTTDEITAIAAGWYGRPSTIKVWCLGVECQHPGCKDYHHGMSGAAILENFLKLYEKADMVTGHYILGHDLPRINAALLEEGMDPLHDKLVSDTKVHLKKRQGISASQENLGKTLGLDAPKVHMDTPLWREANRLTPAGIKLTRKRVVGDVRQHMELREALIRRRWLKPPMPWKSSGSIEAYTP